MTTMQYSDSNSIKTNKRKYYRKLFTFEEDTKLIFLVKKFKSNWKKIAFEMKNRSVRQCKERYFHYLSPDIRKDDWTSEEDILLLSSVEKHGKKWKTLELFFKGRTEIDIRNRFNVLTRMISKKIRNDSLITKIEKNNDENYFLFSKQPINEANECKEQEHKEIQNDAEQIKSSKKDLNNFHNNLNVLNYFSKENIGSDFSDDEFDDFMTEFCY